MTNKIIKSIFLTFCIILMMGLFTNVIADECIDEHLNITVCNHEPIQFASTIEDVIWDLTELPLLQFPGSTCDVVNEKCERVQTPDGVIFIDITNTSTGLSESLIAEPPQELPPSDPEDPYANVVDEFGPLPDGITTQDWVAAVAADCGEQGALHYRSSVDTICQLKGDCERVPDNNK